MGSLDPIADSPSVESETPSSSPVSSSQASAAPPTSCLRVGLSKFKRSSPQSPPPPVSLVPDVTVTTNPEDAGSEQIRRQGRSRRCPEAAVNIGHVCQIVSSAGQYRKVGP